MHKAIIPFLSIFMLTGYILKPYQKTFLTGEQTTVADVLRELGEAPPKHYIAEVDTAKVKMGEDIIRKGFTIKPDGSKSLLVSNYFVCTDCHNTVRESKDAADLNPDNRMDYIREKGLKYLPGSTFWGITNRTSWFKKYGEVVKEANQSLEKSIQLCSRECSCGRDLEDWEMEAVMHYYTSLQLTIADLNLEDSDIKNLQYIKDEEGYREQMKALLKSKYVIAYPATFVEPISTENRKKGTEGDAVKGEFIFENSCLHCHDLDRVCKTIFAEGEKDASWLVGYFHKSNGGSIYNITRTGTKPSKKTKQYMPIYPVEKLTDQHLEDLAAYLLKKSETE